MSQETLTPLHSIIYSANFNIEFDTLLRKLRDFRFYPVPSLLIYYIESLGKYASTGNMELFNTQKNRAIIEKDSNMLSNRISMLQQEEEKIMK